MPGNAEPCVVQVTYRWNATEPSQLSVETNELVLVLEKHTSGWWIGKTADGQVGIFPSNYAKEVKVEKDFIMRTFRSDEDEEHMASLQHARDDFDDGGDTGPLKQRIAMLEKQVEEYRIRAREAINAKLDAEKSTIVGADSAASSAEVEKWKARYQDMEEETQRMKDVMSSNQSSATTAISSLEATNRDLKSKVQQSQQQLQSKENAWENERSRMEAEALQLRQRCAKLEEHVDQLSQSQNWHAKARQVQAQAVALKKQHADFSEKVRSQLSTLTTMFDSRGPATRTLLEAIAEQDALLYNAQERYRKEARERRKWFNKVQELRGNIRVFCRVRPLGDPNKNEEDHASTRFPEEDELEIIDRVHKKKHQFEFDRVFSPQTMQQDVFSDVEPLVTSVLDGYNVCIFAYGQTGSGKTYTIIGPKDNPGVNTRTLDHLFKIANTERRGMWEYEFSVSIIEIYNESIFDLLSTDKNHTDNKLEVRSGGQVDRLTKIRVESVQEVQTVWDLGFRRRATFATDINEHSSRSHCLLSVYVDGFNPEANIRTRSKLHLIDLAGSERVSKSRAVGDRLKEAQAINKSLSALGDVIQALCAKNAHVPFRNSKLTFLLQDSLSGDSKTLMFVNISPEQEHAQETLCSLNFASRARNVELGEAKKHVQKD